MKADYILLAVAFMAVIVAVTGSFYTYNSIQTYKQTWFTGQAINTGTLTLNISATAIVNFTKNLINFSYGSVALGALNATLETTGGINTSNGNWSGALNTTGFIIQNQGSTNVSLSLQVDNAASAIGGTNPGFWWNITPVTVAPDGVSMTWNNGTVNFTAPKPGSHSCLNSLNNSNNTADVGGPGAFNLSVWTPVQTSAWLVCDKFNYMTGNNTIRVDVRLQIPRDAPAKNFTSIFTATATCCIV